MMTVFQRLKARMGQFSQILAIRLYAAGMAFLITLLLGRMLGPSEFGAYVFAMGWVSVFLLFTTIGFHQFAVLRLPLLTARDDHAEAAGVVVFAVSAVTVLSLIVTAVVNLNISLFSTNPGLLSVIAVSTLLLLPYSWIMLRTGILQGLGHPIAGQVPERLVAPTLMFLALGVCFWLAWDLTALDVLVLSFGTMIVALVLSGRSLWAAWRELDAKPSFGNWSGWIVEASKTSLAFVGTTALGATDVIMLGLLSTTEETGIYGIAARFFLLMVLPFQAGVVIVSQRTAKLRAAEDTAGLAAMAQGAANRGFLAALALALPSTFAAFHAEAIFGPGFGPAMVPILILVWVRVLQSVAGQPGPILALSEFVGTVALTLLLTVVINIALNAALIPTYGATGAAVATSISFLLMTAGHILILRHQLGISSFIGWGSPLK